MNTSDLQMESKKIHAQSRGKLEIKSSVPLENKEDLALAYTPGVGGVCEEIASNPEKANQYTSRAHTVAVVSDGSAVLGLGNIGPLAALPVMEGKAILFKKFANLDAWPIVLNVHSTAEIVAAIKAISPGFAAINLEDIAAPQCFEVEEQLQDLGIPVMHDDQHGTAIAIYAALLNSAKLAGKSFDQLKVVINGAGAAGLATAKMLLNFSNSGHPAVKELIICDTKGIIHSERTDLNIYKKELLKKSNLSNQQGDLAHALKDADVFIGLSVAGALQPEMIKVMADKPIIFALANPVPEIYPDAAKAAGAFIVATGRSDFPNQINNALVFPGIFSGVISNNTNHISAEIKYVTAYSIAETIEPTIDQILPDIFHPELVGRIEGSIMRHLHF
ncbi:MAG: NAD(P)-dependent malic enzyme [Candidatus Altimarinota bacterium]